MMETYGKKSLKDNLKDYFISTSFTKKDSQFSYGHTYEIKSGLLLGFGVDKALFILSKGLSSFVPFSFTVWLRNKFKITLIRESEVKNLSLFKKQTKVTLKQSKVQETIKKIKTQIKKWKIL
jgi:hypothetical protein